MSRAVSLDETSPVARTSNVNARAVFGWALAFILVCWWRFKLNTIGAPALPGALFDVVSALDVLEIALLLKLVGWGAPSGEVRIGEAAALLGLAATAVLVLRQMPLLGAFALSSALLWRFAGRSALRDAAIVQFVIVAQYVLLGWPFPVVHNAIGRLDAAVVRRSLALLGQQVAGDGSHVLKPLQSLNFDVMWGCATSTTLAPVLAAFAIVALALRHRLERADALAAALLIALTFALNWTRLVLICWSEAGYVYWHEAAGAGLFAAAYALAALGAAYAAPALTPRR
jgi:exosortase/archaeosortase family protein